jgi:hypothetical protein
MTRRLLAAMLGLLALVDAPALYAQDTPAVFLHGLLGNQATWSDAAANVQSQLTVSSHSLDLTWQEHYAVQADQVQAAFGYLPGTTIAIGHSNGGVVAREWSKRHNLGGIVTVGTPHYGAPVLTNLQNFNFYSQDIADSVGYMLYDFEQCASNYTDFYEYDCPWYDELTYQGLNGYLSFVESLLLSSPLEIAGTFGTLSVAPVITDMMSSSSYLADLNSPGNLSRESAAVGTRVAIVSVAHHFDQAGYVRIVDADDADAAYNTVQLTAHLLEVASGLIYLNADPYDDRANDAASLMIGIANQLYGADTLWCNILTNWNCEPNDTVVPVSSQAGWDDGVWTLTIADGPTHLQEASSSDTYAYLTQALTNIVSIAPRTSGSGSGSGDGGSGGGGTGGGGSTPMTARAAVRGCSNYVEWSPVYQPTSSACHDYCAANGGNACEWHVPTGNCYVELGYGCYVESGYDDWYAEVLSQGTPPPPPPPPPPPGPDGQMHASSAVQGGCQNNYWDPVFEGSADACRSYCVSYNADACEWYEVNGDCYVEWGGGCSVASGVSNWSAAVFH